METTAKEGAPVGLLVRLEANAGRADDVEALLHGALALVREEPATTAWFAVRAGPSTFAIFATFSGEAGRQAHLAGRAATALTEKAPELLAEPPRVQLVDVVATK
ncbi:MAG TPA: antibiotic biosynthesis monooxygenase [Longimicrobium sp.]|jgi:quinol monooxygenase YgiN|nr:antibiotic biosynthesis monooxygenase [Longimicrobium sp.]